jgi:hypothetical protein
MVRVDTWARAGARWARRQGAIAAQAEEQGAWTTMQA